MNLIKKIIKIVLILELVFILGPWLIFIPGVEPLFPKDFGTYGWFFTVLGIIATVPTLIVYAIVDFFDSKKRNERFKEKTGNLDSASKRILLFFIISFSTILALFVLGFFS